MTNIGEKRSIYISGTNVAAQIGGTYVGKEGKITQEGSKLEFIWLWYIPQIAWRIPNIMLTKMIIPRELQK